MDITYDVIKGRIRDEKRDWTRRLSRKNSCMTPMVESQQASEVLQRFRVIGGKQSHDNSVLPRLQPSMWFGAFNEVWNSDVVTFKVSAPVSTRWSSTPSGTFYRAGNLINRDGSSPNCIAPRRGLQPCERLRLQRFLSDIRVLTLAAGGRKIAHVIKKLSEAVRLWTILILFVLRLIMQFFNIGTGALIPLELCEVPSSQIMRTQVPPEKTKSILDFVLKPVWTRSRLDSGILAPPALKYGPGQPTITHATGAWNMCAKRLFKPVENPPLDYRYLHAVDMIKGLCESAREVGINMEPTSVILWQNGQGDIQAQLHAAGKAVVDKYDGGLGPNLIVVVLPEGGNQIFTAVKHFGDVTMCFHAKAQYFASVCLKINIKLGGINVILDPKMTDFSSPTMVMDDVIHPAPGADGPLFTSLIASVDSDNAKYIAECTVQTSCAEIIENLKTMAMFVIDDILISI
ncbi:hypothetical protein BT96DRAFT_936778 [Gymnopus androsaceus JB14]|uniref:Piwi domain-containing protein n=1 Tax=Gymnopus androsaceus JB14 TaxID=1447944 RepID=A0A6A4HYM0_9AGAR|nr:hypothetical protein BT96DRAFT_936778 [Gymnopus androsaceus JB14]